LPAECSTALGFNESKIEEKQMQINDDNPQKDTRTPDELRMAAIMKKRTDQLTADDKLFLAAGIAQWRLENNQ
jgi:hypothetical protein